MSVRRSPGSPSKMSAALLRRGRADVPVDAVDRRVELAADEPLRVRRLPVEHALPGRDPLERRRLLGPVGFGIGGGAVVDAQDRTSCAAARKASGGSNFRCSCEQGFDDRRTCAVEWVMSASRRRILPSGRARGKRQRPLTRVCRAVGYPTTPQPTGGRMTRYSREPPRESEPLRPSSSASPTCGA